MLSHSLPFPSPSLSLSLSRLLSPSLPLPPLSLSLFTHNHTHAHTTQILHFHAYTVTNINTCRGRNTGERKDTSLKFSYLIFVYKDDYYAICTAWLKYLNLICYNLFNTESVNLGAIIGGTIGGVIVLIIAIVIVRHILLQNKRQRGDWFAFNTTRNISRPNVIRAAVVTSTATTTSSQPVSTEPAQAPLPAPFDLPRPEAQGSAYNQPSNPTVTDAPPPAYGTHDKYSSYNEKDEKSDLPPPYQPPYVDTAAAYPTAPQAYPPPSGYAYPPPTMAAYPPGVASYPPAPGNTAYPPPGGQGPNWGAAAYPPYPPQT